MTTAQFDPNIAWNNMPELPPPVVLESHNILKYTPPTGYENLIRLLTNLEHFINNDADEPDPLVKMAVIHSQFEAIHPFTDGNGQTGRILNIL